MMINQFFVVLIDILQQTQALNWSIYWQQGKPVTLVMYFLRRGAEPSILSVNKLCANAIFH